MLRQVSAADSAGNLSTLTHSYSVVYNPAFGNNFGAPIDLAPTLNTMKAGGAVPVKFDLGGDRGQIDAFVAGVGTGGTLTGVGRVLRARKDDCRIVAVEPRASAVLSGGKPGLHGIQGLGAGFVPRVLDTGIFDEVITVADLAADDGVSCGICHVRAEHVLGAGRSPSAPHPMMAVRAMSSSRFCAGCHQFNFPGDTGRGGARFDTAEPMQDTYAEWLDSAAA